MSITTLILLLLKTSIVLNVLALGLGANLADALSLIRRPADLVRAFVSMNLAMPLFALALVVMFNLHPAVKIALVTLSVSPVPPLLPRRAIKDGCGEDYTIGLLVAMALLSIVVIPVTVEIFEKLLGMPLQTPIRSIAELVVRTVLAPVLIGIMVRRLVPSLADRIAKPLGGLAFALLVLALLPVLFAAARTMVSLIGNGTILALAAFALVGLFVGYRFAGPAPHKKHVLALATSSRHPGVAVAIANANFPNQKLVIPAIFLYLIVSGILIGIFSNRSKAGQIPGESEMRPAA